MNPDKQLTVLRVPFDDGGVATEVTQGTFLCIETEVALALRFVRTVTGKAFVGKNRADVAVELNSPHHREFAVARCFRVNIRSTADAVHAGAIIAFLGGHGLRRFSFTRNFDHFHRLLVFRPCDRRADD